MEINHCVALPINEKSQVAEARRHALGLAQSVGLSKADESNVAIIVTEAANNLTKHAVGGELLLSRLKCNTSVGIEVLALDRGPGMDNVERCLQDGYSSDSTMGAGLGALQRISQLFDVYSVPGLGSAILSRYWSHSGPECCSAFGWDVGAVCIPQHGETVCGDGWGIRNNGNSAVILLADGLGHGQYAAEASQKALEVFLHGPKLMNPSWMIEAIHEPLKHTRGAAVAVTEIDLRMCTVNFAGVGNISAVIVCGDKVKNMVSHSGIVGAEIRKIQEFSYLWPEYGILVIHSDGLKSRWDLNRYPGILKKHPALIAGVLYRDYCRGTDDVTVVVARTKG